MKSISWKTVGCAAIIVGCGVWAHRAAILGKCDRLDQLRGEIVAASGADKFEAAEQRLGMLSSQVGVIKAAVPSEPGIADIVNSLTTDLDLLGTTQRIWNVSPPLRSGQFEYTTLDLSFHTSTENAYALLTRIGSYARVVRVKHVAIRTDAGDRDIGHAVELQLQILGRPQGSGLADEGGPS